MANKNLLYGTWLLNETVNVNVDVSIDFTCISNESEMEWDKLYGISNIELAYSKNGSTWMFPYRTDNGWSIESARTIKVSTESNSNALSWLQTNAVKLSDDLNYTNSVNKYNDLMNELSDVINEKAGTTGKKVLSEMVEAAKTIENGITPSGTYEVTDNGEYDITEYAKVNVNVAASGGGENTLKKLLDYTQSMNNMFYENTNITDLTNYIKYSDTENVKTLVKTFYGCTELEKMPVFDVTNVETAEVCFYKCGKLKEITNYDYFNIPNIKECFAYTGLEKLKDLVINSVTVNHLFSYCNNMTEVENVTFTNATALQGIFQYNGQLKKIKNLKTPKATSFNQAFRYNYLMEMLDISFLPSGNTGNTNYFCYNCYSLKTLIIRSFDRQNNISSNAFNNCYHLTGTVNETYNPDGLKDAYIYVPRDRVETLKSATNWSTYADQIRALEDYTVDGTTTGELDESKI